MITAFKQELAHSSAGARRFVYITTSIIVLATPFALWMTWTTDGPKAIYECLGGAFFLFMLKVYWPFWVGSAVSKRGGEFGGWCAGAFVFGFWLVGLLYIVIWRSKPLMPPQYPDFSGVLYNKPESR